MPKKTDKTQSNSNMGERVLSKLYSFLKILFCTFLGIVLAYFVFSTDKEVSEKENRVLQKQPTFTLSSFFDGTFSTLFENWLSDQFPFRDTLVSFKTLVDRTTGKKEQNNVYFGKEGFLFEKQSEYDETKINSTLKAVNSFLKKYDFENKAVIISPNSTSVLSEYLPNQVEISSQKNQLSNIEKAFEKSGALWIDCFDAFSSQKDKTALFYRTDHHWTTKAAYCAFEALMKEWNISTKDVSFDFYTVSNDFEGTLSASSGALSIKDEIEICMPQKKDFSYVLNYESENVKKATFFDKTKLETSNKYEVFLGGNFDKIEISTNCENMNSLLLFKDSYANCMIPMLSAFFSKIVVVDPRYYNDDISNIMEENEFTHILFLYNLNTFLEDTSIKKLLG